MALMRRVGRPLLGSALQQIQPAASSIKPATVDIQSEAQVSDNSSCDPNTRLHTKTLGAVSHTFLQSLSLSLSINRYCPLPTTHLNTPTLLVNLQYKTPLELPFRLAMSTDFQ